MSSEYINKTNSDISTRLSCSTYAYLDNNNYLQCEHYNYNYVYIWHHKCIYKQYITIKGINEWIKMVEGWGIFRLIEVLKMGLSGV